MKKIDCTHLLNVGSQISLLLVGIFIIYLMYLNFWPFKTLDIIGNPIPIINKNVNAGEDLLYSFTYTKSFNQGCTVYRTLVNDSIINLPPAYSNTKLGTHLVLLKARIPEYAPSGKYIMRIEVLYQINLFRTIRKKFVTEEFIVTNNSFKSGV